ncbi:TrmH family RNA methyltransferase [Simiduia agarivorans]|uniref:TrmH family RNA methyltransferase n=1 Tax=Simiduia agarivorans TaxID=447471 RepID=UPI0004A5E794|nr:RNA methyltransferase [Simiduia agarivorans]
MNKIEDSAAYRARKQFFDGLLTIYGRKPVLEALEQPGVKIHRLHLADSNKPAGILDQIEGIARDQNAEVLHHSRQALSRISKNAKQDQGVAADLRLQQYQTLDDFLANQPAQFELLAVDGITNPQNLGMILRSVAASGIAGVLLPSQGCAQIDPLVIKASAGALFRCPIIRCEKLVDALRTLQQTGSRIGTLSSHAQHTLGELPPQSKCVFVLGNETHGVSEQVQQLSDFGVRIPMHNGVESLNVAITASLIAFRHAL